MRLPHLSGLALGVAALIAAQAGKAIAACTVVTYPQMCEENKLADVGFWRGSYAVEASPSLMLHDGKFSNFAQYHSQLGTAKIEVDNTGSSPALTVSVGDDFKATLSQSSDGIFRFNDMLFHYLLFFKYDLNLTNYNKKTINPKIDNTPNPAKALPIIEWFFQFTKAEKNRELLSKIDDKQGHDFLQRMFQPDCGVAQKDVLWRGSVPTKDKVEIDFFLLTFTPMYLLGFYHTAQTVNPGHKPVDIAVFQVLDLHRGFNEIPGAVKVRIEDEDECDRIRFEKPWLIVN